MSLFNAFGSVFSIVIMIIIGYALTHNKWLDDNNAKLFAKIVVNIALPTLMITNLMSNFDKEKLLVLGKGLFVPFTSIALAYVIGKVTCYLLKVPKGRRGIFLSIFFVSNTIFIGLPVNLALFGEESVPYVLLYYIANTTFFWTIGVYEITKDSSTEPSSIFSKNSLKRILSPPFLGFVLAVALILLNVTLPKFILDTCKYLGNLTTPLSMMFIGHTIYSVDLSKVKFTKEMFVLLLGRFVISPLLVLLLTYPFPLPSSLMRSVFIVQAAMPAMTNTAIIGKAYDSDYEYAAVMITITTILSLIIIPIYKLLLA